MPLQSTSAAADRVIGGPAGGDDDEDEKDGGEGIRDRFGRHCLCLSPLMRGEAGGREGNIRRVGGRRQRSRPDGEAGSPLHGTRRMDGRQLATTARALGLWIAADFEGCGPRTGKMASDRLPSLLPESRPLEEPGLPS